MFDCGMELFRLENIILKASSHGVSTIRDRRQLGWVRSKERRIRSRGNVSTTQSRGHT